MDMPAVVHRADHGTEVIVREDIFDYRPTVPDGSAVEWHLNFAASDLFCAYSGGLFAQDEMQVAEHPVLGALREALLANGESTSTVESGRPTPILVTGAERRCRIATDANPAEGRPGGLYGNQFARASARAVERAVTVLNPPTVSNILAIEAPSYGHGPYRRNEIEFILRTAYTGFAAAVLESHTQVSEPRVVVHTGFWGCGAYGGNRILMALLQVLAAQLAAIDVLVFHAVSAEGSSQFASARDALTTILGPDEGVVAVTRVINSIAKMGLKWGRTDGN